MTVNYTLHVSKSIIYFCICEKEKIHMPIKSTPKYPLIREISMWIINHDLWIDPLKKITSMNPWPYAIQTSPPFTDNSHLWNSTPLVFTLIIRSYVANLLTRLIPNFICHKLSRISYSSAQYLLNIIFSRGRVFNFIKKKWRW